MNKKLLSLVLILFFTAQNVTFAQNAFQGNHTNINQINTRNQHYFLITTPPLSLKGKTNQLKSAFATDPFVSVEVNESHSSLKIVAHKGTKIGDIKNVLAGLHINIKNFQEEYSNTPPAFFLNN